MSAANEWDRSCFATSGSELDIREALTALDRVLECGGLADDARRVVEAARTALQAALG
jgi:hypothetical protein